MWPTELHTERLLLRPFHITDVPAAQVYRNDPEFARFLPHVPQPFTEGDAEAFVRRNIASSWVTSPTFALVLAETLIGTVSLDVDRQRRMAMLSYALGRAWWGHGLATEAAWAAVQWGQTAYDLKRLRAEVDAQNVRSQRVLEKLGMRYERFEHANGLNREHQARDTVRYGLDFTR